MVLSSGRFIGYQNYNLMKLLVPGNSLPARILLIHSCRPFYEGTLPGATAGSREGKLASSTSLPIGV